MVLLSTTTVEVTVSFHACAILPFLVYMITHIIRIGINVAICALFGQKSALVLKHFLLRDQAYSCTSNTAAKSVHVQRFSGGSCATFEPL